MHDLKIINVANCGVLIKTKSTNILVDGLNSETEHFDGIDSKSLHDMMACIEPFERIDHLLFTHGHQDHYDYKVMKSYLEKNKIQGLFLPKGALKDATDLIQLIERKDIEFIEPQYDIHVNKEWVVGDAVITYFCTIHSGEAYKEIPHFAFLITVEGQKIYFSGDSDFTTDDQVQRLMNVDIDIAFYNPYHLNTISGREIIREVNARRNFIYHIPSEGKDVFRIRKQAMQDIVKYRSELPTLDLILSQLLELNNMVPCAAKK